jgi:hypothetical protein
MKRLGLLFLACLLLATQVQGQESGYVGNVQGDKWAVGFYLWGTGMNGTLGVGPFDVPVDISFSDVLDNLDFGLFGHLEFHADNNFGFFTDLMFLDISGSANTSNGRITSDLESTILEGAITYNLAGRESPFDLFAGFRYWDMDLAIGFDTSSAGKGVAFPLPPGGISQSGSTDWTDFMLGARWIPRIGEKWWIALRGDIAGGNSETYNLAGSFIWRFAGSAATQFGYRHMHVDIEEGAGLDRRSLEVDFSGPFAAIEFTF